MGDIPDKDIKIPNTKEVSDFSRLLDGCISSGKTDAFNVQDYAPVALALVKANAKDLLEKMKDRVYRCWKIAHFLDTPEPTPLITDELLEDLKKLVDDKGDFDWHEAARRISDQIHFAAPVDTGEFLYYDPLTGNWHGGCEELIAHILRDAIPNNATRYMRDEILAQIKDGHYVFTEFSQREGLLVNCSNGVVEVETMRLLPHDPDYHFRYVLPVKFNHRKIPRRIMKFLSEVAEDDLNKALRILESYAYCLIPGYPIQKAITLMGRGNNGKSVTLDVLANFLGKRNIASLPLQTITGSRFASSELQNKLANISGDVSGGKLKDTSIFKQLTGGDFISGEVKMIQKRPLFVNWAKMLYGFNQLPESTDQTMAFFRRFEMILLTQDFSQRGNKNLIHELIHEDEMSGLLNLLCMVFVPALMYKGEFHDAMSLEAIQLQYNLSANPALAFIQEHIEADPETQIPAAELYNRFVEWAKTKGLNVAAPESFGYTLRNLSGLMVSARRIQEDGVRKDFYVGIKFVDTVSVEAVAENKCHSFIKIDGTLEEAIASYFQKYVLEKEINKNAIGGIGFFPLTHEWKSNIFSFMLKNKKSSDTYATSTEPKNEFKKAMTPTAPMPHGNEPYILLSFKDDFAASWFDQDWYFHKGDLVHVPESLANLLIGRSVAHKVVL